ncbi:MAG: tRNA guanosine(34) transglycosylase Tgt [Nanoarchaeota archaeon]
MNIFQITHKDKKTKARVGILKTKKGKIETPFFMPVATKASVKHISSKDLESMNCKACISNTFVLHLRPGEKLIKKMGGIGKFMNYSGINITDSGGFQMYSPSCYLKSDDKGVWFKNPFEGGQFHITPEKNMKIQIDIDSEIAMCLDTMPLLHHSKHEIEHAVLRTTAWAERCKKEHEKLQKNKKASKKQLLFGICQGGIYEDLRKKSAEDMTKLNFDGYSIGGLALGETREQEMKAIEIQKSIIPENKPVYLMGAGNPPELIEAISRGIDMFDSRFPTKNARHGYLFTSKGVIRISNKKHEASSLPIDENCDCFVCKNCTRSYIRYQLKMQEAVGYRLASYHNIFYLQRLMEQARKAIKQGKFKQFKNKLINTYKKADKKVIRTEPQNKKCEI